MGLLGKPWYDAETNKQLKAKYDRAMLEWRFKSPEEKAILMAAEENRLLQLTQFLQNNQIINNQTFPTEPKVVGTFHVPFTKFGETLGTSGRHSESVCYFCRRLLTRNKLRKLGGVKTTS